MLPYEAIKYLNLRNRVLMFCVTCQPTLMIFRILEALFGTSPYGVELSLGNYGTYHATTLECIVDKQTNHPTRVTREDVKLKLKRSLTSFCLLSLLLSITAPSYVPFNVYVPVHSLDHGFWHLLHLGHLVNNFIGAGTYIVRCLVGALLSRRSRLLKFLPFSDCSTGSIVHNVCERNDWFGLGDYRWRQNSINV